MSCETIYGFIYRAAQRPQILSKSSIKVRLTAQVIISDGRTGKNGRHALVGLLRQSVFGRLAGYEDVNDAQRLRHDPAMRWIVGGKAAQVRAASPGDHAGCLFCAVGAMLRPRYSANIVQNWLPALDGVVSKLERGAKVADIGCGTGQSTFIMARAFPSSTFVGYDFHPPSIEHATAYARTNGAENIRFEVARAKDFPARDLDLVTCFDVLHDLGDPVGAAAHIHRSLKPDGTWMLMERLAGDATEDNLGPVGRVAYAFSTMVCVPVSLSQEVGMALGAQAGQMKLTEVIKAGGFTQVRRAAQTPLNMILEARY